MPLKIKPRPAPKAKVYDFDSLCNRLQQANNKDALAELFRNLAIAAGLSDDEVISEIGRRCEVSIYLSVRGEHIFVSKCSKQDGSGYEACLRPSKYSISSSNSLSLSVILAYIKLCKQFGRFI